MFRIHMLPAGHGDALILEYGSAAVPQGPRRILIDGGTDSGGKALTGWLEAQPPTERHFELLVITHIDADHIAGVLRLLAPDPPLATFGQVWFNGFPHLDPQAPPPANDLEHFGAVQGERLSERLLGLALAWNRDFARGAVRVRDDGALPRIDLPGGLRLTVVGPTADKLAKLKPDWAKECAKAGLDPLSVLPPLAPPVDDGIEAMGALDVDTLADGPFDEDTASANGSTIALLAEFDGRTILLAGDAHPSTLLASIARLTQGAGPLALNAFKVSHHASKSNVSRELIEALSCPLYLVSTNGAHFKHPDREAVARIVKYGGDDSTVAFNFRNKFTTVWDDPVLMHDWRYKVAYPAAGQEGLLVDIV